MMRLFWLLIGGCYTVFAVAQALPQSCLVEGTVKDVITGRTVSGVKVYARAKNNKTLLATGDNAGKVKFELSPELKGIDIEREGYSILSTNISILSDKLEAGSFQLNIPMFPVDSQDINKPYMQSEQVDFTLESSGNKNIKWARTLVVSNALNKEAVHNGTVCFIMTKDGSKVCRDLEGKPIHMEFKEADIIGFTVQAKGFQVYNGNLILENRDSKQKVLTVNLTPELTVLAIKVSKPANNLTCSLTDSKGASFTLAKTEKGAFSGILESGSYRLSIRDEAGPRIAPQVLTVAGVLNFYWTSLTEMPVYRESTGKPGAKAIEKHKLRTDSSSVMPEPKTLIFFEQSDYIIKNDEKLKLDNLAHWLVGHPDKRIRIVGHTDNVGDATKNNLLSEHRAKAVRYYLRTQKVDDSQMQWAAVGGKHPTQPNDTEENKGRNRRVEILILD